MCTKMLIAISRVHPGFIFGEIVATLNTSYEV